MIDSTGGLWTDMDMSLTYIQLKKQILEKEFSRLNETQRAAVFSTQVPLLILAGAGSGKTTVIVNRIAYLIRYGNAYFNEEVPQWLTEGDMDFIASCAKSEVSDPGRLQSLIGVDQPKPWNVLAITFTNKAAGELKSRLESVLGEQALDIWAGTFHSICARILRREIEALGYDRSFAIYDSDDSVRVLKGCIKDLNLSDKQFPPKQVLGAVSRFKDRMIEPKRARAEAQGEFRQTKLAELYELYEKRLRGANALDFDDIICCTVKLFEQFPEVLAHWQRRFAYVMVDEYQDTNHAQFRLVALLSAAHQRICVVGDDDQSIYRFRGATIENILSFENQFDHAKVIRLEQNYRSTQTILNAANQVISHNTQRKGKNLWTKNNPGELVQVFRAQSGDEESAYIASAVEENVRAGKRYSDHAILYRLNAQSAQLEQHFIKAAIPYRIIGGLRFYERKEIKDILAYLAVINNPSDTVRLTRIINEPKRGIGDATVAMAREIADSLGVSLFEVISEPEQYAGLARKAQPLHSFADMLRAFMERAKEATLDDLLEDVLEDTGYMQMLKAQGDEGLTRLENLSELMSNVMKYQADNEQAGLSGFLEEISLLTDIDNYNADADAVVMMTIHSAKGLEFPNVYIVGMEEGIFPGTRAMYEPAEVEEERRLAYVAITRAKEKLTITNASSRMLFGQTTRNRPSRFLSEMPSELKNETGMLSWASKQPTSPQTRTTVTSSAFSGGAYAAGAPRETVRQSFTTGERVRHKIFGDGLVVAVTPMGNDTLLEIAFDTRGTKKIMANFTSLEKLA